MLINILILLLSFSCAFESDDKKTSSLNRAITSRIQDLDSDSDGVSDSVELKHGLNPEIANLPVVSTYDVKLNHIEDKYFSSSGNGLSLNKKFKSNIGLNQVQNLPKTVGTVVQNNLVRKKILNSIGKYIFRDNYDENELPIFEDALLGEMGCLSYNQILENSERYSESNNQVNYESSIVNLNYKLNFQNLDFIDTISYLEGGYGLRNFENSNSSRMLALKGFQPIYKFSTGIRNLPFLKQVTQELRLNERLKAGNDKGIEKCSYYLAENFNFKRFGKEFIFKNIASSVKTKNSLIFFLTPKFTKWVSINPNNKNILDALKLMNHEVVTNNEIEILSIDNMKNELSEEIDHLSLNTEGIRLKKRWYFLSSVGSKLTDSLQENEVYIVAYADLADISKHSSYQLAFDNPNGVKEVSIQDSYVGDEIELKANFERFKSATNSVLETVRGLEEYCVDWDMHNRHDYLKHKNVCIQWKWKKKGTCKLHSIYSEVNLNKWVNITKDKWTNTYDLKLSHSNRVIKPIFSGNSFYYRFKLEENDIKNGSLSISLVNPNFKEVTIRTFTTTKHGGAKNCKPFGNHPSKINVNVSTRFKYNLIRRGVYR